MTNLWRRVRDYAAYHGVGYTLRRAAEKLTERTLHPYERVWRGMRTPESELETQGQSPPAAGLISVPLRYMHTPGEVVDLAVVEQCVKLLVEFTKSVGADETFAW